MSKLPKYQDIIGDAIFTLQEKSGSSSVAIIKYSKVKYGNNIHDKRIKAQLKKMVKDGNLIQAKNSFKLAHPNKYQKRKVFMKVGGIATRSKKSLKGPKITRAADIIKKLNEGRNNSQKSPPKTTIKDVKKVINKKKSSLKTTPKTMPKNKASSKPKASIESQRKLTPRRKNSKKNPVKKKSN